ncbi:MAG: NAD+ synthase [Nitrospinae bacterium]|nr:NAD+ synthase [Nitrospinota bacterium]MZH41829.1 NAD+ synthase [Nitrospinota bacterium]
MARTTKKPSSSKKTVTIRVALAQVNALVGGFKVNAEKVKSACAQARKLGAEVVLFPELMVTGYPPEDLLLKKGFLEDSKKTLKKIASATRGLTAVVGFPEQQGKHLYNSAALLCDGKHVATARKVLLPNYGVFDEKRYFTEGEEPLRFSLKGVQIGLTICEDIWEEAGPGKSLSKHIDLLLNISSSPYHKGKGKARMKMIGQRAKTYKCPIAYVNLVGGQDELVFDGHSLVVGADGKTIAQANSFAEEIIYVDVALSPKKVKARATGIISCKAPASLSKAKKTAALPAFDYKNKSEEEEVYSALVLGTRDYIHKNRFSKVVLGLSGGIDSSLTAAVAVDALGPENVTGVLMPSPHSSKGSVDDSLELAKNLKIKTMTFPIVSAMKAYEYILKETFQDAESGLAEENLQARIRGNLLMALSNKFGWMVLTTGNKSEFSMGYCTLYGDMAGGFAVIKDVPKILVYDLCRWLNRENEIIPQNILTKEPSAELRPDQLDTDSLPPYDLLDPVLLKYIEEDASLEQIKVKGLSKSEIARIARLVDLNEYKRRQGPPGVKITPKAFGKDRRLPISRGTK